MPMINRFFSDFIFILNEMAPYLLLGFIFAGILNVLMPQKTVNKYLGRNNMRSVFNAAILGVPLPLCSCGVIPTGISFYKNGASKGATNSFLISTPQTGVDSILVSYSLLGLPFAILRPIIALITGLLGGGLTNWYSQKNKTENTIQETKTEKKSLFHRLIIYPFVEFLQDIANWLVIGLVIAAIISAIIPDNFFTQFADYSFLSMLIILIASIPLYVCATSSVPIAAVLIMKGLSPGAALVFLMAGPATNAATITVIRNAMGKKALRAYLFSIISGALFFGILINEFLPVQWFTPIMTGHAEHQHEILPKWLKTASSLILGALMLHAYFSKYKYLIFKKKANNIQQTNINTMKEIKIIIEGMNCNHCKQSVLNVLNTMEEIKAADVDLNTQTATITGDNINLDLIKEEVEKIGYKFSGVK